MYANADTYYEGTHMHTFVYLYTRTHFAETHTYTPIYASAASLDLLFSTPFDNMDRVFLLGVPTGRRGRGSVHVEA